MVYKKICVLKNQVVTMVLLYLLTHLYGDDASLYNFRGSIVTRFHQTEWIGTFTILPISDVLFKVFEF